MIGSGGVLQEQEEAGSRPDLMGEENPGDGEVPSRVLDEVVRVVCSQWTKGYEILGPAATTAGLAVMGISDIEMLVSAAARAVIL